ncbi:uncharacterized protein LOC127128392 [Lathyrus oleraceus]|uniref:uncharacterized protein LOC127128392 n=1 Tax=Pisum sativum TaxID=3888 RepID=UPI0021D101A8|nr:uncharacterized protein LOC127128392 [Pisum sativum]
MGLESASIRTFNDLGENFVKQYKYNVDMAPDRDQLRAMSQKDKETFKEHAQRWRELAAQIVPPLEEKEVTKIFLKTLSSFYYERMIASAPSDFTEIVNMGMRLEEGVREGRVSHEDNSVKKYGGFARKKEGETHAVSSHIKRRPSVRRKEVRPTVSQHQVAHIASAFREAQQPQQQRQQQQAYQPRNNNNTNTSNYERKRVTFDPILMTYAELYPSLIDRKLITPRDPPVVPANAQWWYNPELHCMYHFGAPGHDVENCFPLKTKVQDLVRSGILFFEDVGLNVKKNPLLEHGKAVVNMVQGCPGKYKVLYLNYIRQYLVEMHKLLCEHSHYEHDHDRCHECTVNERGCRKIRKDIQEMIDQGMIEILQNHNKDEVDVITLVFKIPDPVLIKYDGSKKKVVPTLVIKLAGPVLYVSNKAVSYRYNAVMLEDGKEVSLPSTSNVSISDVSGVTCSGRVFSAQPKSHEDVMKKDVVNPAGPVGTSSNHYVPVVKGVDPVVVKSVKAPILVGQSGMLREDGDEMLRLIKRS